MTSKEIKKIEKAWPRFTPRVLALLEAWDGGRGLLFVSHDDSGDEVAPRLASHLTQNVITYCGERKREWEEKIAFLRARPRPPGLFDEPPKRTCVLVHELDKTPKWMFHALKGLFESYSKPCVILATTTNLKKIPRWLSSHFMPCTKTGKPRKMA